MLTEQAARLRVRYPYDLSLPEGDHPHGWPTVVFRLDVRNGPWTCRSTTNGRVSGLVVSTTFAQLNSCNLEIAYREI